MIRTDVAICDVAVEGNPQTLFTLPRALFRPHACSPSLTVPSSYWPYACSYFLSVVTTAEHACVQKLNFERKKIRAEGNKGLV